jgi:NIPSNAP
MRLPVFCLLFAGCLFFTLHAQAKGKSKPQYYQLETFYFSTSQQEALIDDYLKTAYLPALHGVGLKNIGVFKPIANDTATLKAIYVLIVCKDWNQVKDIAEKMQANQDYLAKGASFLGAPYDAPAYKRKEITLIKAFSMAPKMVLPVLTAPLAERVYELRSYESASDNLYRKKVHMFNEGGEVALFKKLGFNAIFYGDVVAGSKMPNLMYMTSFNSLADRNAHWDVFRNDPEWKTLSGNPVYQHTVSKAEVILTRAAPYSDY